MKNLRECIWESNSSSSHSLTIFTKKEFEDWKSGENYVLYNRLTDDLESITGLKDRVFKDLETKLRSFQELRTTDDSYENLCSLYEALIEKFPSDFEQICKNLVDQYGEISLYRYSEDQDLDADVENNADFIRDKASDELRVVLAVHIYIEESQGLQTYETLENDEEVSDTQYVERTINGVDVVAFGFEYCC